MEPTSGLQSEDNKQDEPKAANNCCEYNGRKQSEAAADDKRAEGGSNCELKGVNRGLSNVEPVELRLLVRRSEAGALIGKRGSNIKRVRETFKTSKISIPDTGNGPERVVCLSIDKPDLETFLADLANVLQEKSYEESGQIEIKLLIHSSHAGSLIGIAGQSIKKLRNDSRAAIKIYEMCCPLSSERVCAIKSKPIVVVRAIKLILDILKENPIKGTIKLYDALNFDLSLADKYGGCSDDGCLLSSPGDCLSAAPSAFVNKFPAQANLWMKHFPCRPNWCHAGTEPSAAQLGALYSAVIGHRQPQIIADAMPMQVSPTVCQFRAASNRQTSPLAVTRGLSLLNQSPQCHDSCQVKPFAASFTRAPSRLPPNTFRHMQNLCRPQISQRFHPYLQAGRYAETKHYQQSHHWNPSHTTRQQSWFGSAVATTTTTTTTAMPPTTVASMPIQASPQRMQQHQFAPIQQIVASSNDVPQVEPIGFDPSLGRIEPELGQSATSIETQTDLSCPKYGSETSGDLTCPTRTCAADNNTSHAESSKDFYDVVAEKLFVNETMSPNGCHERTTTHNRPPESSQ